MSPEEYRMDFLTRDKFPEFLNEYELNGIGAEIGVQTGIFSEVLLKKWNGSTLFSIDSRRHYDSSKYTDIAIFLMKII